jgi:hypothetical protein
MFKEEYERRQREIQLQQEDIAAEIMQRAAPCPLCGKKELEIQVTIDGCPPWTRIRCNQCNLFLGGMSYTEILERWNIRKEG